MSEPEHIYLPLPIVLRLLKVRPRSGDPDHERYRRMRSKPLAHAGTYTEGDAVYMVGKWEVGDILVQVGITNGEAKLK